MIVSVLTVTARQISLEPLCQSLAKQAMVPGARHEWIIVDAHWPSKREMLTRLHRQLLYRWRLLYAPAPESWAFRNGFRFLANIRNQSLLLAGGHLNPANTYCLPLDDDLTPESDFYVRTLMQGCKQGILYIPPVTYAGMPRRHPSGNAATPFPLAEALGLNGYDEILDANWPGTATYEDVDLCFRLKGAGFELKEGPMNTRVNHQEPSAYDPVRKMKGIKCNHSLRVAGSPEEAGGRGLNWETNEGIDYPAPFRALWDGCPYLDRERCTFLSRRCEIDLDVARFGHEKLEEFLASRPRVNLMEEWMKGAALRNKYVIGEPLMLDLDLSRVSSQALNHVKP